MIQQALDETSHRRQLENRTLQANIDAQNANIQQEIRNSEIIYKSDLYGKIIGLIVCGLCLGAAVYLGVLGHDILAGAIAAIPTGALIKAFVIK